jgi:hypothetical protein
VVIGQMPIRELPSPFSLDPVAIRRATEIVRTRLAAYAADDTRDR